MKTILITGGNGRLAKQIEEVGEGYKILTPHKHELDITNDRSISLYLTQNHVDYVIHAAALTKPMSIHEENINKSIEINIIGTANIVKACNEYHIKLIHISTDYVYPSGSKDVTEDSPLLPFTNYGWSKLGAESAVQMYKNSLILRLSFMVKPFPFENGASNVIRNVGYIDDVAKQVLSVIDEYGVLNIGTKEKKSMYELGLETNEYVTPIELEEDYANTISITLNIDKLNRI